MVDDTTTMGFQCAALETSYQNQELHHAVVEPETMTLHFQCAALETSYQNQEFHHVVVELEVTTLHFKNVVMVKYDHGVNFIK